MDERNKCMYKLDKKKVKKQPTKKFKQKVNNVRLKMKMLSKVKSPTWSSSQNSKATTPFKR